MPETLLIPIYRVCGSLLPPVLLISKLLIVQFSFTPSPAHKPNLYVLVHAPTKIVLSLSFHKSCELICFLFLCFATLFKIAPPFFLTFLLYSISKIYHCLLFLSIRLCTRRLDKKRAGALDKLRPSLILPPASAPAFRIPSQANFRGICFSPPPRHNSPKS